MSGEIAGMRRKAPPQTEAPIPRAGSVIRNGSRFCLFSLRAGWAALAQGEWNIGLRCLVSSVHYSRFPVFPALLEELAPAPGERVLDIGSPKLPSLYLALKRGVTVYATDLQDDLIFEWSVCARALDAEGSATGRFVVEKQDARRLTYPPDSFDGVYSISVLEHIPETGDSQAMREIARVLKPGGRAFIQVPFRPAYEEVHVTRDVYGRKYDGTTKVFFERRYDAATLASRIIQAAPLRLLSLTYHRERWPFLALWGRVPFPLRVPLMWLEPFWAMLFLARTGDSSAPRIRGAYLTFRKE
jgi:SAM-dependent methyltransferase